jgi:solute:Na+ symporter, SSS family
MLLFGFITWLGFAAALAQGRSRPAARMGPRRPALRHIVTWFLVGGDLYTAYTFIAVPALAFGAGAIAFFAVPYTIMIYPILFLVFPRLWHVCHKHGYITPAISCAAASAIAGWRSRHGHRHRRDHALYRAAARRHPGRDRRAGRPAPACADLPLIIAFVILAAFTYSSGLRAPASIAIVKDMLIYITAFAAVIVIPIQLGGFGKIFAACRRRSCCWRSRTNTTGAYGVYATLALGSALALFLYPHSMTGILSASSGHAIRRNAAMLPGYSFMLGLLALVGFFAIAAGVGTLPEYAAGFKQFGNNFAVPALFLHSFPSWFVGIAFAAIGIGALVPAAIMSIAAANLIHPQHPPRVHQQEPDRQSRKRRWRSGCR